MKCAPDASATKTGKAPGHLTIQLIGTPPGITVAGPLEELAAARVGAREEVVLGGGQLGDAGTVEPGATPAGQGRHGQPR